LSDIAEQNITIRRGFLFIYYQNSQIWEM